MEHGTWSSPHGHLSSLASLALNEADIKQNAGQAAGKSHKATGTQRPRPNQDQDQDLISISRLGFTAM
ncbi:GM15121 [Drosophila sechellia]|uniref:GM15121 n=1 Tax=Drosophila sechellia TaxID=7238 RepID=B4INA5_DROSE|nr:GM15121 [Drosophila sechellia]